MTDSNVKTTHGGARRALKNNKSAKGSYKTQRRDFFGIKTKKHCCGRGSVRLKRSGVKSSKTRETRLHTTRTHLAFIICTLNHTTTTTPAPQASATVYPPSAQQGSIDRTPDRKQQAAKMGVVHKVVRRAASLESQRAAPPSPAAAPPAALRLVSSSASAVSKYPRFGRRGAPQVSCSDRTRRCLRLPFPVLLALSVGRSGRVWVHNSRYFTKWWNKQRITPQRQCVSETRLVTLRPPPPFPPAPDSTACTGIPFQALRDFGRREPRHHRMDCNREGV